MGLNGALERCCVGLVSPQSSNHRVVGLGGSWRWCSPSPVQSGPHLSCCSQPALPCGGGTQLHPSGEWWFVLVEQTSAFRAVWIVWYLKKERERNQNRGQAGSCEGLHPRVGSPELEGQPRFSQIQMQSQSVLLRASTSCSFLLS